LVDPETPYLDTRRALIQRADELRDILREIVRPIQEAQAKLIQEADAISAGAVDEIESQQRKGPTRKVRVTPADVAETVAPVEKAMPAWEPKAQKMEVPLPAGRRACSACRKPGHRAGSPKCEKTT